jgi:DNA-binding IclR family transcriptional regulator
LDVLEAVIHDHTGRAVSLADVAGRTALPKSTTHRILAALSERGYVVPVEPGRYAPGPQVFVIASIASNFSDYPRLVRPLLADLRRSTKDTIHLALLVGTEAVYIDKLDGDRPYRMASEIGNRLALHCTAIGKAILADLMVLERDRLVARLSLSSRTARTITDRAELVNELNKTRARRYAIDDEENEDGIRCVGAAFCGHRGTTLGALSVSAPTFALATAQAHALAPGLIAAADAVSLALGSERSHEV